jgi:hypothetical protein
MTLDGSTRRDDGLIATEWKERTFQRTLDADRLRILEARSVASAKRGAPPADAATGQKPEPASLSLPDNSQPVPSTASLTSVKEHEPNDGPAQALKVPIPILIEGAIQSSGDVDSFKFDAKAGEKLAFEIETMGVTPPLFNPRLSIVDDQNRELFSNVHRRVSLFNNNSDRQVYLKRIEPKAIYTFEKGGEYRLEIRDITSRYGEPNYRYRICIRPQVAHVGEVQVADANGINVVRGRTKRITIMTSHEEGFAGDVAFSFTALPEGVEAFPAAELNDKRDPTDIDENADAVAAKIQTITAVLLADAKAPLTTVPKIVRLYCRPIAGGQPGPGILVSEIPLMVVDARSPK